MKNLTLTLLASLISLSAFADPQARVTVDCRPPQMMTGGASIRLSELKIVGRTSEGYSSLEGKLDITIGGSTAKPVVNGFVAVKGVVLQGGAIQLAPSNKKSQISTIYITDSYDDQNAISYVEMKNGQTHMTSCRLL